MSKLDPLSVVELPSDTVHIVPTGAGEVMRRWSFFLCHFIIPLRTKCSASQRPIVVDIVSVGCVSSVCPGRASGRGGGQVVRDVLTANRYKYKQEPGAFWIPVTLNL
jgi:hypothetical protein